MSDESARRVFVLGIWGTLIYLLWVFLPDYFWEHILDPLGKWLQVYYGPFFDWAAGTGQTGRKAAWVVVILVIGMMTRRLATELGIFLVLFITWGLMSRGAPTVVQHNGQPVSTYDPGVQRIGKGFVLLLGLVVTALIVGNLFVGGLEDLILPALGANMAGYYHPEWQKVGYKILMVLVGLILLPILLYHLGTVNVAGIINSPKVNVVFGTAILLAIPATFIAVGYVILTKSLGWRPMAAIVTSSVAVALLMMMGQG